MERLTIKEKQIQELTAWKESASKVLKNLDLQAIGKTLGIGLGEDISVNVLPKINELKEQNAELVDMLEKVHDYLDVIDLPKPSGLTKLLTKYKNHDR